MSEVSVIASPLAEGKMLKHVVRLNKKCAKEGMIKRGIKEVVKTIRKKKPENCFVVIAGDISPIDVISHLPVLCENEDIPYIYIPSKEQLGTSVRTRRPTSCIMVIRPSSEELVEKYENVLKEIRKKR
eukprot:TRINITY_DN3784_c0_g1_i10.p1 TRINITY_DN3784_c0_g1~~TRINITY_DN3784_c0_g1_i10.p1  ORF type:complete len:147 (-),score=36.05 TRINITY_DN3784_c0_g1_i10:94-477(-)